MTRTDGVYNLELSDSLVTYVVQLFFELLILFFIYKIESWHQAGFLKTQ